MAEALTTPSEELVLEVDSELYDETHPGWLQQVDALVAALDRETGTVRRELTPQPGQKGGMTTLLLSGFTGASVEVVASMLIGWLSAHAGRRLRLRTKAGETREVAAEGGRVDEASVRELVELLRRATASPAPAE